MKSVLAALLLGASSVVCPAECKGWVPGHPIMVFIESVNYDMEPVTCDGFISLSGAFNNGNYHIQGNVLMRCAKADPQYHDAIPQDHGSVEISIVGYDNMPVWGAAGCSIVSLDTIALMTYLRVRCDS